MFEWLSLELIFWVAFIGIFLFFIFKIKKRKYPFGKDLVDVELPNLENEGIFSFLKGKTKKSKKSKSDKTPKPNKTKTYGKHENECRRILESIFHEKFNSVRPDWLKNPSTGKNLELDCFSPNIQTPIGYGLALEMDGAQHAQYTPHFHKHGTEEFNYQVKKDIWKDAKCRERGILLIRVPHYIYFTDLENFIRKRLREENVL